MNVRLPKELFTEGKKIVETGGFSNFQELIKDAVRHRIEELRKERALRFLEQSFGSEKPRPRLTKEQREEIALRHTPERARQLMKKYGFL